MLNTDLSKQRNTGELTQEISKVSLLLLELKVLRRLNTKNKYHSKAVTEDQENQTYDRLHIKYLKNYAISSTSSLTKCVN